MVTPVVFAWIPGVWELLLLTFIVLLFFGSRLPSVMRSLGQGVSEFKKGIKEDVPDEKKEYLEDKR